MYSPNQFLLTTSKFPSISKSTYYSHTNLKPKNHNRNNMLSPFNITTQSFYLKTFTSFSPSQATIIAKSCSRTKSTSRIKSNKYNLKLFREDTPTLKEAHKLYTFYKTTEEDEEKYRWNKNHKKTSIEDKETKRKLYNRFKIQQPDPKMFYPCNLNDNNNVSIKITHPFFKSYQKARKTLNVNQQIAMKIAQTSNVLQIERYDKNINEIQNTMSYIKKMPKIRIKKTDNANPNIIDANDDNNNGNNNNDMNDDINNNNGQFSEYMPKSKNKGLQSVTNYYITYTISNHFKAYKPTSRSFFTLNIANQKLFLFGGLNAKYNNDMWSYSLTSRKWQCIKVSESPVPRYGHTTVVIDDYLIIYGGITPENYFRIPEEMVVFNTRNNRFSEPKYSSKIKPGNRKGHIAVAISQTMLIHGGYDQDTNQYKSNALLYYLIKNSWSELEATGEQLPFLMNHSAVVVNDFSNTTSATYSIYKQPEDLPNNRVKNVKIEGVYMFGGFNDKKKMCNELWIIKTFKKPCVIMKPKINGRPPLPRINCKMIYLPEMNMVIIHGGCGEGQNVFNDIIILNAENLNWIHPSIEDSNNFLDEKNGLIDRTEHEIITLNRRVYILGGRNIENYHKMDFEVVMFHINSTKIKNVD